MRVGVFGAGGRVGSIMCRAVHGADDLKLVAAVDPRIAGESIGLDGSPLRVSGEAAALADAGAQVAIDFTTASAALENMRWCASNGVHAVVGTTGLSGGDLRELEDLFERAGSNCIIASNFAVGAALMMHLAQLAAPYMDGVEIVELHHDGKQDAPSGTAVATAEAIAAAREKAGAPAIASHTRTEVVPGTRGGEGAGGVHIHAVRLPGLVSHQEVVLGATGQSLTIRHDSYDRTSYVPGVLLAVRSVSHRPGLTRGLEPLLSL